MADVCYFCGTNNGFLNEQMGETYPLDAEHGFSAAALGANRMAAV